MPSLALVDDHGLFRTALRRLLETEAHLDVVAEASDGREAVARSIEIRPDLVLMDVELPGISGVEATRQIREALPDCKVLILSGYDRSDFVQAALTAGASGYVLKTATSEELLAAVRAVLDGKCYLSPDAARYVVDRFAKPASAGTPTLGSLSNREREVLQLVAEGLSSKEIADRLRISNRTVDTHRASIMTKVGSRKTAGLVRFAIREGLVTA
ncbi:MAG: response regulator transcription factor [Myxococcota bacterium]|jgi:DNA-binding NarL/FixJ family response regulator|nr:response regulator transcription factor [bacterium]MDP6073426.1 response regulator transcription factor [Myxococcota bacterium]MDP6243245.1 response regulator transcription factor [Myxococcota bacterium]MDP7074465.1 response regulator transcription factor [Myxococcota bacterium]MDP7301433.1 response regulator transcription factor [Myxococcota bacterium]